MWLGPKISSTKGRSVRFRMRSAVSAAAVLATVAGSVFVAQAAIGDQPYPSQQQVDQAKAKVTKKLKGVKAIQAALDKAQADADAANTRAEIAAEAYNGAMWKLEQAKKASREAKAKAKAAHNKVKQQRDNIGRLAAASYQESTEFTSLNAILGGATPTEMLKRAGVVDMANAPMKAAFDNFQKLSDAADAAQAKAKKAETTQRAMATQAAAAKNQAAAAAASAQQIADSVASQRDDLVKQLAKAQHISVALANQRQEALAAIARAKAVAAAKAAAARAAAEAAKQAQANNGSNGSSSGSNSGSSSTPPPTPSGRIGDVIAFAKAQLGEPYVWAGAGPNVWDCSGLVMMAFRQIGISLPHYAASQYTAGTPIPVSQARAGDLYFWSSDGSIAGIHHVAIALGNGEFIEAPHTGANVRYNNVNFWYPTFAARL